MIENNFKGYGGGWPKPRLPLVNGGVVHALKVFEVVELES